MAYTCSICGEAGHTKRRCPKAPKSAAAGKKAAAPKEEFGSVVEQLEARKARLQREIETIDRVLPDLRTLELGQ